MFVITGPSGVGKGTLIRGLLHRLPELELSVSATTRSPRPGERDGVDYHFLSPAEFDACVAAGDFVEHAEYSGNRYGTLRSELERRLSAGAAVVLEIEVQGALEQVDERMRTAERELEARGEFDHEVVNDRLEQATESLAEIVRQALNTEPANLGGPEERTQP